MENIFEEEKKQVGGNRKMRAWKRLKKIID
jgi:hypothetical protein